MMKKLFTLITLLTCFLGANAIEIVDVDIDFSTLTDISEWPHGWIADGVADYFDLDDGCLHFHSDEAKAYNYDIQLQPFPGVGVFNLDESFTVTITLKGAPTGNQTAFWLGFSGSDTPGWVETTADFETLIFYDVVNNPNAQYFANSGSLLLQCGHYVGEFWIRSIKISHEEKKEQQVEEGFFVAATDIEDGYPVYDFDNAVRFIKEGGDSIAIVGGESEDEWVNQVMISTVRGNDDVFKANTLTVSGDVQNNPDNWMGYEKGSNVTINLPVRGMWKIRIDPDESLISFEKLVGEEEKVFLEVIPNPTEVTLKGMARTSQDWDNQFWIAANRDLQAGEQFLIEFDYYMISDALDEARVATQYHKMGNGKPCTYLSYEGIGDVIFTTEEQHLSKVVTVPRDAKGMRSICFNMACVKAPVNYTIKNVVWMLADKTERLIDSEGTEPFWMKEGDGTLIHQFGTYIMSIKAIGNGYVTYAQTTIQDDTDSFIVNEGTSAILTFTPDEGYRIKSVKVNGTDVTSNVTNNKYTISNISRNTTVEVVFESKSPIISFADNNVKTICVANWDTDSDGELSEEEAAAVTYLGGAFYENTTITSFEELRFFVGIEDLSSAFRNCSKLKKVIIPNSVKTIGKWAFQNCSGLTGTLVIPTSVTSIGEDAFSGCSGLNGSLTFPSSVISIGNRAFCGCSSISELIFPNSITTIGEDAFSGCSGLTGSLTIPNSVISIGKHAFNGCTGLIGSLTIPNSVTSIGNGAFYGCSGLSSVTIPNSVTLIGDHAFFECSNINRVISQVLIPSDIPSFVFKGISSEAVLQVPYGTKPKYQELSGWTQYFKEIVEEGTYNLSITVSGNGTVSYDETTIRNNTNTFTIKEETSATIIFAPDNGYRIKSVRVNNKDVTSSVSNSQYTIKNVQSNTTVEVEFEAIPPTIYTLSIKAVGGGSASYSGTTIRSKTSSFTVTEGSSVSITFTPDKGYQIKNVKENNTDVTSYVSNDEYVVEVISRNTEIEVEFEAIPPTTYTLSITTTGNGSATYDGTTIRGKTSSFTVTEGTSATITFTPDNGYRIKSVKVNSTDVTSSVSNNKYSISNISGNTTVEVEFEVIPPTTYTLSISAIGNGSATYDGTTIRNKTITFTVNEGSSVSITIVPDNGYRIKYVMEDNTDVTSYVSNNEYVVEVMSRNIEIEVEFEAIPPTTYTLSITTTGNGSATYDGTTIRGKTSSFTVTEGTSATITFTPDNGYRIKSVKVNSTDVTSSVSNNKYSISNISGNTTVEVEFEAIPPTTYTLSVSAIGNGSATYDGTTIRNKTITFTVNEGSLVSISFKPDNGYRIKSVKENNTNVTSYVSNNEYVVEVMSRNIEIEVEFEAIPPTTYTLSITAIGNGSALYDGMTVKNETITFTLNEGSSATITFASDNGYHIKSVKVNSTDVTSTVSNGQYTVSNISSDTMIEVEFEAIPPTTYTLSIKATGNGSASYDGTTIKNKTTTFTVNEGSSVIITFAPDNGYRIKSVKINNSDVISSVSNNKYTISSISRNTDVEVEFEVIPTTTYKLSITSTGNGSASYEGTVVKNKTTSFTVNEGSGATITFTPDNGYRIKSVKVNNTDVTSNVSNNKYTVSNIRRNTTVEVEFEVIPPTVYTLSIKATGNGSVTYDGTSVRSKTSSFNVNGGSSATITISPDDGNRIKSVTVNSSDVTSRVMNNSYTISNISGKTNVEVVFEEIISELTNEGVYYKVVSETQQTVKVVSGDYGLALNVPASFTAKDKNWKVVSVEADVLSNPELAAIIWNPEVALNGTISNPNLLLYVKDKKYAPNDINNVIVNGVAENIMLQDAESDNNFYCPQAFTAKRISYIHRYGMKTGFNDCQGWETIVLPFDVTTILSATGTEIVPYNAWQQASNSRPFWLYSMNSDGWKAESGIKANMPYIISMPNNEEYDASYNLSGDIQFMSSNVQVIPSGNLSASKYGNKQFVPNYQNKVASQDIYALNVNNQWNTNTSTKTEGSAFIRSLRQVRPFEAYLTIEGGAGARGVIPVFEDGSANGIPTIPVSIDRRSDAIYNLNGQRVSSMSSGIYIQNGKKIIKK